MSCFNPRPGHVTGATRTAWRKWRRPSSFNPRPGHVTGATSWLRWIEGHHLGFNPRPGHVTGATFVLPVLGQILQVSIRAPVT